MDVELQVLVKEIADELGERWEYEAGAQDAWRGRIKYRQNGAELSVRGRGDRVEIFGSFPIRLPYDTRYPRITAAKRRGAAAIAGDIRRRFLPKYFPLFIACTRQKAAGDAYQAQQAERRQKLSEVLRGRIGHADEIHFKGRGDSYGYAHVYGDSVDFSLKDMPLEDAMLLAVFLRKREDD